MTAIRIASLTKKYKDKTAVDSLSLDIEQGEIFALLGINGAGKSTTIKMLSCLVKPTGGDADILTNSVTTNPVKVKELINVSPQETAIAPNLYVKENLELIARIYGSDSKKAQLKADAMIDLFNLAEVAKHKSKTLSGGMQRRLSIAMALISEPKILFLDEPTLGLDVIARRELWAVIKELKGKITIILTTHYMEEAEMLSDRIGIIAHGRLKALGTAPELIAKADAKNLEDAFVKLASEGVA